MFSLCVDQQQANQTTCKTADKTPARRVSLSSKTSSKQGSCSPAKSRACSFSPNKEPPRRLLDPWDVVSGQLAPFEGSLELQSRLWQQRVTLKEAWKQALQEHSTTLSDLPVVDDPCYCWRHSRLARLARDRCCKHCLLFDSIACTRISLCSFLLTGVS